jgi:hypothetical protein
LVIGKKVDESPGTERIGRVLEGGKLGVGEIVFLN